MTQRILKVKDQRGTVALDLPSCPGLHPVGSRLTGHDVKSKEGEGMETKRLVNIYCTVALHGSICYFLAHVLSWASLGFRIIR